MKRTSIKKIAIACFASLALAGCVSLMEKTGRVLDGSAFKDKKVAQYRGEDMEVTLVQNKDSGRSVIISLNDFPMMFFRASEPDENGTFFLTSLEYLAGGIQSWNEYTLDLLGEGTLSFDESAVIALTGEIEPVQISAGRIHRYDTRITGNEL